MSIDGFLFSTTRALQSRWIRLLGGVLFVFLATVTTWSASRLFPLRANPEGLVTHQSVYVGIDQLGTWSSYAWIVALWWACVFIAFVLAVLVHPKDRILAGAILVATSGWSVLIGISLITLTLTNV